MNILHLMLDNLSWLLLTVSYFFGIFAIPALPVFIPNPPLTLAFDY